MEDIYGIEDSWNYFQKKLEELDRELTSRRTYHPDLLTLIESSSLNLKEILSEQIKTRETEKRKYKLDENFIYNSLMEIRWRYINGEIKLKLLDLTIKAYKSNDKFINNLIGIKPSKYQNVLETLELSKQLIISPEKFKFPEEWAKDKNNILNNYLNRLIENYKNNLNFQLRNKPKNYDKFFEQTKKGIKFGFNILKELGRYVGRV